VATPAGAKVLTSSAASPAVAQPVGAIGQLMPPGAGGNLLRSTGFFGGAGAAEHLTVLVIWALVGLGALLAASVRARRPAVAGAPMAA
jgi:hypothetical protein